MNLYLLSSDFGCIFSDIFFKSEKLWSHSRFLKNCIMGPKSTEIVSTACVLRILSNLVCHPGTFGILIISILWPISILYTQFTSQIVRLVWVFEHSSWLDRLSKEQTPSPIPSSPFPSFPNILSFDTHLGVLPDSCPGLMTSPSTYRQHNGGFLLLK